ncbi:MAG: tetratricopeptide repeat protein [Bacteroidota bacterium]
MTQKSTWNAAAALALLTGLSLATGCAHGRDAAAVNAFETRRQIARHLVESGDWEPALAYVSDLHREAPEDAGVLVLRATIYRERGLRPEAEADLRDAIRLEPNLAAARSGLGVLCDMARRPAEAEEQHRQAVKLEPRNPTFLNNLGFSLFLRGKTAEAVTFYEQAARIAPTVQRTRTNLGFAYAARGDLQRAAREFEMGGSPADAKINLGFAYERRGDMANAYTLYAEAARLEPTSRRARVNLVHAAQVSGRPLPAPLPGDVTAGDAPAAPSPSP